MDVSTQRRVAIPYGIVRRLIERRLRGQLPAPVYAGVGISYLNGSKAYLVGANSDDLQLSARILAAPAASSTRLADIEINVESESKTLTARDLRDEEMLDVSITGYGFLGIEPREGDDRDLSRLIGALGGETAGRLAAARIGIIGVGGLGSQIASLLALGGTRSLTLVDPDVLEASNLHRMPFGLSLGQLGLPKVEAVADLLRNAGGTDCAVFAKGIEDYETRLALRYCDLLVVATDNAPSRRLAATFASDYLITAIGIGTGVGDVETSPPGFEVGLAVPGDGCLNCVMALPTTGSFEFGTGRRGSLASLNQLAAGFAMRVIEDFASARMVKSQAWRGVWDGGLRVESMTRAASCACRSTFGRGDFGLVVQG